MLTKLIAYKFAVILLTLFPLGLVAQTPFLPSTNVPFRCVELDSVSSPSLSSKAQLSQFAISVPIDPSLGSITPTDVQPLSDSNVLISIAFHCPNATSMSLWLSSISIPQGASLSVSDPSGNQASDLDLSQLPNILASNIVSGTTILLQYAGPANPLPSFTVSHVFCGFQPLPNASNLKNLKLAGEYGSSASCEVPAACFEDNDALAAPRRAVCRLILNGTNFGTGLLVNNTAQDRAPLVITSAHVLGTSAPALNSCQARFGFEEPLCLNGYVQNYSDLVSGATLVAYDQRSDVAIIRLSRAPSLAARPFWAGWAKDLSVSQHVVSFHHPYGDAKKVSVSQTAAPYSTFNSSFQGSKFRTKVHWRIAQWTSGSTEGGSSGAPLFNANGQTIGALSGGDATCYSPINDYFWMLGAVADFSSDDLLSASQALDPLGKGLTSLDGLEGLAPDNVSLTNILQNFTPNQEANYLHYLSTENPTAIQPCLPFSTSASIWTIRIYGSDVICSNTSANGPTVSVSVRTQPDGPDLASASKLLNYFASADNVVDFVLSNQVSLQPDTPYYIVVSLSNASDSDVLPLVAFSSNSVPSLTTDPDHSIMLSMVTSLSSTQAITNITQQAQVSVSQSDGTITISGAELRLASLFDLQGRLATSAIAPHNSQSLTINSCPLPSGLYILRVLNNNGLQSSFKIVIY